MLTYLEQGNTNHRDGYRESCSPSDYTLSRRIGPQFKKGKRNFTSTESGMNDIDYMLISKCALLKLFCGHATRTVFEILVEATVSSIEMLVTSLPG